MADDTLQLSEKDLHQWDLLNQGYLWVVDADLKSFFDTIPHAPLMRLVASRVADGRVLKLLEHYLRAGVMEEQKGWPPTECGTPQGAVISPLLANIYLDPLDHEMARAGVEMIRYADGFVLLCRSQTDAPAALGAVRAWVENMGLQLHPDKTRLLDASAPGGFDFLGYHFERGLRWPRQKSLLKFRDNVRDQTSRWDGRALREIIPGRNRSLRGWYEYYQHSHANVFAAVDGFGRRRLRSLLERRHGRRNGGRGAAPQRWNNAWFAAQGLWRLTAAHEFTVTILKPSTHCLESRLREIRPSGSEGGVQRSTLHPYPIPELPGSSNRTVSRNGA